MDDVLLDTLARTLAAWDCEHWDRLDRGDRDLYRERVCALLAVTGDDGVPLLSLASDWEQVGSYRVSAEGIDSFAPARNWSQQGWEPIFRRRSSVTGTEETSDG